MMNDDKLLLREWGPDEEAIFPAGYYGANGLTPVWLKDGRKALYQPVKDIIWDCDERPLL